MNVQETMKVGKNLARKLSPGDIVCLTGELGSGKTTFVKGMAQGLGLKKEEVHSPTFVLMNIYEGRLSLYHFDLYRIDQIDTTTAAECEEFFYGDGISVIEWAEKLKKYFPKEFIRIGFEHKGENERMIKISVVGKRYHSFFRKISKT